LFETERDLAGILSPDPSGARSRDSTDFDSGAAAYSDTAAEEGQDRSQS
jgi:hypothetical protein